MHAVSIPDHYMLDANDMYVCIHCTYVDGRYWYLYTNQENVHIMCACVRLALSKPVTYIHNCKEWFSLLIDSSIN